MRRSSSHMLWRTLQGSRHNETPPHTAQLDKPRPPLAPCICFDNSSITISGNTEGLWVSCRTLTGNTIVPWRVIKSCLHPKALGWKLFVFWRHWVQKINLHEERLAYCNSSALRILLLLWASFSETQAHDGPHARVFTYRSLNKTFPYGGRGLWHGAAGWGPYFNLNICTIFFGCIFEKTSTTSIRICRMVNMDSACTIIP